jgi:carboxyl-terminal processing protease
MKKLDTNNGLSNNYNNDNPLFQPQPQPQQPPQTPPENNGGRKFVGGLLVGFLCACFVLVGAYVFLNAAAGVNRRAANPASSDELLDQATLDKIRLLEKTINDNYYKTDIDVEDEKNGIYKGLLDSLGDPYSVYYTEEELVKLMSDTQGVYYGIGAYVSLDNTIGMPRISGVIPGTPAESAGLAIDDIIYEVDKNSTQGLTLEEVVKMIKGEEGTFVHLTLIRGTSSDNLEIDVTRAKIEVPTVNTRMLDDGIGYLQITEFDDVTYDQFVEGMAELRGNDIKGLVIDLRSNPGGNLSTVCDIARQLLPEGHIVYTMDREGNREDYDCDGKHEIDIPVVVLVNKYSASASEILAGALKDYQKATLVGTTTYGKGIVQRIINLKDGTAVKLTVSSYYTPNGVNIHGIGIDPDVEIEYDAEAATGEDKVDNQLEKAIEVMKDLIDN